MHRENSLMAYLYMMFSGVALTSQFGVFVFWLAIPFVILCHFFTCNRIIYAKFLFLTMFGLCAIVIAGLSGYFGDEYNSRVVSNVYLSVTSLLMAFVFYNTNACNKEVFLRAIKLVLVINLVAFYLQFISFYIFHYIIDYNLLSGGLGGRYFWGQLFRASGLFDEPAVYSLHMVALLVMLYMQERKFSFLISVTLASLFLSFSFMAIFQAILLSSLFIRNKKNLVIPVVFCSIVVFLFKDNIYERYIQFVNGSDGSNNTKLDTLSNLFDGVKWLYGYGLVGYNQSFPLYYQGLYDLTYWGANLTLYGIVVGGGVNVISLIVLSKFTFKDFLLINIVLLKLSVPTYGVYWCFVFFIIWYKWNVGVIHGKNISSDGH